MGLKFFSIPSNWKLLNSNTKFHIVSSATSSAKFFLILPPSATLSPPSSNKRWVSGSGGFPLLPVIPIIFASVKCDANSISEMTFIPAFLSLITYRSMVWIPGLFITTSATRILLPPVLLLPIPLHDIQERFIGFFIFPEVGNKNFVSFFFFPKMANALPASRLFPKWPNAPPRISNFKRYKLLIRPIQSYNPKACYDLGFHGILLFGNDGVRRDIPEKSVGPPRISSWYTWTSLLAIPLIGFPSRKFRRG